MSSDHIRRHTAPADIAQFHAQARKASELMKALSHETRLMILCLLNEGEMAVSEIEETLGTPQAALSQQLARLRTEGLVTTRREGRMIYYRIADGKVGAIVGTLYDLFCRSAPG